MGICSYDWILFTMQFLEKMPNYLCLTDPNSFSDNWVSCGREEICADLELPNRKFTAFKPNKTDDDYLDNWVEKLDMMCLSDTQIGLMGSSFFLGLFLFLPIIPSLGDKYGRKIVFKYTLIITMVVAIGLHFSTNYNFTLFCTFVMGALWNGKNIVGMSYADELLHKKHRNDFITVMFIFGSIVMFSVPFAYITFTKSWLP